MYNNKYYLEMRISSRIKSPLNSTELQMMEFARLDHNRYFNNVSSRQTKNRKYISMITTRNDIIGFYLETEYPIANQDRIGNALHMFSVFAANYRLDLYVSNHRFMRAA